MLIIEDLFNRVFTARYNPFYYLGAIAISCILLLVVSGIYLFIFYKMGNPYESVKYITEGQWYIGRVMRGIHRYAADGLVLISILHMIRIFVTGRYRHWRWLAWVSGIALLFSIWITGIVGYWLVWDQRAQMIAQLTSEFLDFMPIFGERLSMSFAADTLITSFFFFMGLFIHIFVPVVLGIILWVHVKRISMPVIHAPRVMTAIVISTMLILSIIKPATSLLPADTKRIVATIGVDWFYLFFYPVLNAIPAWASWLVMTSSLLLLVSVPWIRRSGRDAAAVVMHDKCTGCSQCARDCPYESIQMMPRTDDSAYELEAVIEPDKCAACGICVGSCSFDGVDLPGRTAEGIMDEIKEALADAGSNNGPVLLGLTCSYSAFPGTNPDTALFGPDIRFVTIPCAGMIHPSWIERGLHAGADGVFICGCRMGDCHYRLGNKWFEERFMGLRVPMLKRATDRSRIRSYWLSAVQTGELLEELKSFQDVLKNRMAVKPLHVRSVMRKAGFAIAPVLIAIPAALILYLSDAHYTFSGPDNSLLKLSIKHTTKRIQECDEFSILNAEADRYREMLKESNRARMQLKNLGDCGRERRPLYIELYIDNEIRLTESYRPGGIGKDGSSSVYENYTIKPGIHHVVIKLRDSVDGDHFDYSLEEDIEFKAGDIRIIDFDRTTKKLRLS